MQLESVTIHCSGPCPECGVVNNAQVAAHVVPGRTATATATVTCGSPNCNCVFEISGSY